MPPTRTLKTCPSTMTGMLNALVKKYPDKYITIEKKYVKHTTRDNITVDYYFYVEDNYCIDNLAWEQLCKEVSHVINE